MIIFFLSGTNSWWCLFLIGSTTFPHRHMYFIYCLLLDIKYGMIDICMLDHQGIHVKAVGHLLRQFSKINQVWKRNKQLNVDYNECTYLTSYTSKDQFVYIVITFDILTYQHCRKGTISVEKVLLIYKNCFLALAAHWLCLQTHNCQLSVSMTTPSSKHVPVFHKWAYKLPNKNTKASRQCIVSLFQMLVLQCVGICLVECALNKYFRFTLWNSHCTWCLL